MDKEDANKDIKETWRVVVTERGVFEGYLISNTGKVKSLKRNKEIILKEFTDGEGYKVVCLCRDNKMFKYRVHRLMSLMFLPNVMNYPEVDHRDANASNNILSNLRWVTHKQNCNNPITRKKMSESKKKKEGM